MTAPILSHFQTHYLLQLRSQSPIPVQVSLDLGISQTSVRLEDEGIVLPGPLLLPWADVEYIEKNEQACYTFGESGLQKIQLFSDAFNRLYTLMPTAGAPTMLISGIPMHRIKGTDPMQDTRTKVNAAAPRGYLLDTSTGLGYTALLAAKKAQHVLTIELDPTVLELCRLNPWSTGLFDAPNISRRLGDSFDVVEMLDDNTFDRILHDPPTFSLAGHLYSGDFYRELRRVLKPGGRLFHYIGDPKSKSGANITAGSMRRLQDAGFKKVIRRPQAFGLIAYR